MTRRFLPALAALLGVLVTAGCFASADGSNAAAGHRLRVALAFAPVGQLSPYTDDATILTQLATAETLVTLDRAGTPAPALAASWSATDPTTLRLVLRAGVRFHDGTPLTAAHAATALTHAAAASPPPRALAKVKLTAKAVNDSTLEVSTAAPDPALLQRLSSPQLVVLAPKAYRGNPAVPQPVGAGTGPFRLTSVQGTASVTLDANDSYWAGQPAVRGIDARFVPDGVARAGALRAGEVDVATVLPAAQLPNIRDRTVLQVPLPRTVGLYLNSTNGRAFADPALRATVRSAVEPAQIATSVYEGLADPGQGLFGPASPWASDRPARSTAPTTAAAGRAITLATYSDRAELPEVASAVAAALTARGFTVRTVVRAYSELEPQLMAGAFDAVLLSRSYLLDAGDPIGYLASDFGCAGSYNLARLCDPALDRQVRQASAHTDLGARRAAALAIEADLLDRAVVVPVVHERAAVGITPTVSGLAEDPYERALVGWQTAVR